MKMDQNKIKDCFNSVNIPVLPRCDELLTNYEFSHKNITSVDFIESPAADATVLGINEGQIVQMPAGNVGGSGSGANSSYRLVITESEISYRTSNGDNIGYALNLNDKNELITAIESGTPIQLYFPDLNYGLNVLAIQP